MASAAPPPAAPVPGLSTSDGGTVSFHIPFCLRFKSLHLPDSLGQDFICALHLAKPGTGGKEAEPRAVFSPGSVNRRENGSDGSDGMSFDPESHLARTANMRNAVDITYTTAGCQTFIVKVYTEARQLPCCAPGQCGTATRVKDRWVAEARINLGLHLMELARSKGAFTKSVPLFAPSRVTGISRLSGAGRGVPKVDSVGEGNLLVSGAVKQMQHRRGALELEFSSDADLEGSTTEVLLHALLANAKQEDECLVAAMDILNGETDDRGVTVSPRTSQIQTYRGINGNSLLHVAFQWGLGEVADVLVKKYGFSLTDKTNVNKKGQTPITSAISNHDVEDGSNIRLACKTALELDDLEIMFDVVDAARYSGALYRKNLINQEPEPLAKKCQQRLYVMLMKRLNDKNLGEDETEAALNFFDDMKEQLSTDFDVAQVEAAKFSAAHATDRLIGFKIAAASDAGAFESSDSQMLALNQALFYLQQQKPGVDFRDRNSPSFQNANFPEAWAKAFELRDELSKKRMLQMLDEKLDVAIQFKDIRQLMGVISYGQSLQQDSLQGAELPQLARAKEACSAIMCDTLAKAMDSGNVTAMNSAIQQCVGFKLDGEESVIPVLKSCRIAMVEQPRKECIKKLEDAVQTLTKNPDDLPEYLFGLTISQASSLGLEDHPIFKQAVDVYRRQKKLPVTWDVVKFCKKDVVKPEVTDKLRDVVQYLVDKCFVRKYTRDRHGEPVPHGLTVVRVIEVQQPATYLRYVCRRDRIFGNLDSVIARGGRFECYATDGERGIKTWKAVKTWAAAMGREVEPVNPFKNEFYLWHGTKPDAAAAITNSDFRCDLSGSNAGTLYGRGLYFAECPSKSDEYTEPDLSSGLRPLILCRVVLGNVNCTAEQHPNVDQLVKSCTRGAYDSVLGDREKCRNTFREMIVYDNDQVYPEFIVWYKRRIK
mmetsp:Transcript_23240/g.58728  ORF Transcript_23240/g.58728 Transcript_23240/m.58728 type:complete len:938 (+) Transcript_23240:273-3086(+)|eukprot:g6046.t1